MRPTGSSTLSLRAQGFTLLELLVAVAIFAVMAALAYGGLNTVVNSHEQARQEAERLADFQRAWFRLGRDLEQAAPRLIRDEYGDYQPAMRGGAAADEEPVLEFTRAGRADLGGKPRSRLQRVAYVVREGRLVRLSWTVLDRAQDSEPTDAELLAGVENIAVRFLDTEGVWHNLWPDAIQAAEPRLGELPQGVEVTLDTERWGRITRLYRTASIRREAVP